jgi:dTDP-4-dehydrorhamnose 3,5-epimerase
MEVTTFEIKGPVMLKPARFLDDRGFVSEVFRADRMAEHLGPVSFVQSNHALSRRAGTVRGLHFQAPPAAQSKLVRVLRGAIYDVAVDIRAGSPTFGRHVGVELSAANWRQFWIPSGFAHGFCTLEPDTEVEYNLTGYYSPAHELGIRWDDPALSIAWPAVDGGYLLSPKDGAQPLLADMRSPFRYGDR